MSGEWEARELGNGYRTLVFRVPEGWVMNGSARTEREAIRTARAMKLKSGEPVAVVRMVGVV